MKSIQLNVTHLPNVMRHSSRFAPGTREVLIDTEMTALEMQATYNLGGEPVVLEWKRDGSEVRVRVHNDIVLRLHNAGSVSMKEF